MKERIFNEYMNENNEISLFNLKCLIIILKGKRIKQVKLSFFSFFPYLFIQKDLVDILDHLDINWRLTYTINYELYEKVINFIEDDIDIILQMYKIIDRRNYGYIQFEDFQRVSHLFMN